MITLGKTSALLLALYAVWSGSSLRADDKPIEVESLKKELAAARMRIAKLEKKVAGLRTALDEQRTLLLQAQVAERMARLTAGLEAKVIEEALASLSERKFKGAEHPPLPRVDPQVPPALPPTIRGEVTDVEGDLLIINIGIDAGLRVGIVLELYRGDGTKPLGTVKVTDAFNLYPKAAVVRFYPSRKAVLRDLKPNELPKKGDQVRPVKSKD